MGLERDGLEMMDMGGPPSPDDNPFRPPEDESDGLPI